MFVMKSKYNDLLLEKENLKYKLESDREDYENWIKKLKTQITELESKINQLYDEELEKSDFEFDFKSSNAFSIERVKQNGENATIIGYFKDEDKIGEWTFTCSFAEHQKLAEQFRKIVLKK